MVQQEHAVPSPAARLAMFRASRVESGVKGIVSAAQAFREQVDKAITGAQPDAESAKSVTKAFVASYHAFSESLEAARSGSVITGPTVSALEAIMKQLKSDYADGLSSMRQDVTRLEQQGPVTMRAFCAAASDKIDRLEQFWQTTYQHAPKYKM